MGLILGIITVALLLACAVITVWTAGAIYYDVCGGAKWGRWVALGWVVGVIALFAAWQPLWQPFVALLGAEFAVPRLVVPTEAEPRPRLGSSVAVLPRAVRAGDAVTIENVRNFDYRSLDDFTPRYEARTYHLANLKGVDVIFFNWGTFVDVPPCPGLRLRIGWPHLHVDRGAIPEGAAILRPSQFLSAAGVDLRRCGRTRRSSCGARNTAKVKQHTSTASIPAPRNCGHVFLDYVDSDQSIVRDAALVPRRLRELHNVLLPASQHAGAAATGASLPTAVWIGLSMRTVDWTGLCLSRNSADSLTLTTLRTRPLPRDSGIISVANSKAPP